MSASDLTFSELRIRALADIGETTSTSHYGNRVDDYINDGLYELAGIGSDGVELIHTFTTTAGVRAYPLPTGFIGAKFATYDGTEIRYRKVVDQDFFSSGTSTVDRYAIWQNQMLLGPHPPSAAKTVTLYYYGEPPALTSDNQTPAIPNRFRHYLAIYAAARLILNDGVVGDATPMMEMFKAGVKAYREWQLYSRNRDNFLQVRFEE